MYESYDEVVNISRVLRDVDLLSHDKIDDIWEAARERYFEKNPDALNTGKYLWLEEMVLAFYEAMNER